MMRLEAKICNTWSTIAEAEMEKIFDPFYTTKPFAGTGLGLPWVKRMIGLYDGKIMVESELGQPPREG